MEYSDRPLNRLTTFLRLVVAIPILVVLANVGGAELAGGAGGLLVLAPLLMIVLPRAESRAVSPAS